MIICDAMMIFSKNCVVLTYDMRHKNIKSSLKRTFSNGQICPLWTVLSASPDSFVRGSPGGYIPANKTKAALGATNTQSGRR